MASEVLTFMKHVTIPDFEGADQKFSDLGKPINRDSGHHR